MCDLKALCMWVCVEIRAKDHPWTWGSLIATDSLASELWGSSCLHLPCARIAGAQYSTFAVAQRPELGPFCLCSRHCINLAISPAFPHLKPTTLWEIFCFILPSRTYWIDSITFSRHILVLHTHQLSNNQSIRKIIAGAMVVGSPMLSQQQWGRLKWEKCWGPDDPGKSEKPSHQAGEGKGRERHTGWGWRGIKFFCIMVWFWQDPEMELTVSQSHSPVWVEQGIRFHFVKSSSVIKPEFCWASLYHLCNYFLKKKKKSSVNCPGPLVYNVRLDAEMENMVLFAVGKN